MPRLAAAIVGIRLGFRLRLRFGFGLRLRGRLGLGIGLERRLGVEVRSQVEVRTGIERAVVELVVGLEQRLVEQLGDRNGLVRHRSGRVEFLGLRGGLGFGSRVGRGLGPCARLRAPREPGRALGVEAHGLAEHLGLGRLERLEAGHHVVLAAGHDLTAQHATLQTDRLRARHLGGEVQRDALAVVRTAVDEQAEPSHREVGEDGVAGAPADAIADRRADAHALAASLLGTLVERMQDECAQRRRVNRAADHQLDAVPAERVAQRARVAVADRNLRRPALGREAEVEHPLRAGEDEVPGLGAVALFEGAVALDVGRSEVAEQGAQVAQLTVVEQQGLRGYEAGFVEHGVWGTSPSGLNRQSICVSEAHRGPRWWVSRTPRVFPVARFGDSLGGPSR